MLIDRCVIEVRSGKGGDGAVSFLQDRNTAKGGPDGGNGGRGGSIYLVARRNLNTLYNFRHSRVIMAMDGEKGMHKNMYGRNGPDVTVEVPCGTIVTEERTGRVLADLKEDGEIVCVAKGGRGGRGTGGRCLRGERAGGAPRLRGPPWQPAVGCRRSFYEGRTPVHPRMRRRPAFFARVRRGRRSDGLIWRTVPSVRQKEALWGYSFVTMKGMVAQMPVFYLIAVRNVVATVAMVVTGVSSIPLAILDIVLAVAGYIRNRSASEWLPRYLMCSV